jgi:hypothetical protein
LSHPTPRNLKKKNKKKGGLAWYTGGSKTNNGTGAGVYGRGVRKKLTFSLGQCTTAFQAEVYAIKACTVETETSVFSCADKLPLKHLTITKPIQSF